MASSYDKLVGTFKPGSVTRIKLVNFLTYNKVEFYPGPRLNLVCGPNGTGKSTILNAMCLGLGGEPRHLGRADDAREFITHGKDKALVEIEVAPHEGKEGHIFRRVIDRNKGSENGRGKGSSTFFVNGEQSNIKEIRNIVSKVYNISIDNLCTFLPQDRVGSFSGFNSKQLLEETEKSLSGSQHLFETHQTLIKLEAEFLTGDNNVDAIRKRLKAAEADFANMEREKQRMQERQDALESIDLLEKKIIWLKYDEIRSRCIELKGEKDAARKALDAARLTVAPLEEQAAQLQHKVQQVSSRLQTLDSASQQANAEMKKQVKKYENHSSDMDEIVCQLGTIDEAKRIAIRELEKYQDMLAAEEVKLNALPKEEDLKLQMEDEANEVRSLAQPFRDLKREQGRINQELREAEQAVHGAQSVLNKMNDVKQNRRNKVFQQFPNLKQISDFVNDNRKEFRRPVWGPIACEVEIKSNNAAAYLEQHVPNHVFKSFVVECSEDYNLLYQKVRVEMNLPINILTVKDGKLAPVERVYSDAKMKVLNQEHGVIGYLDQAFTAPDPIMQALRNEGRVHKVLVGGDQTQESLDTKDLIDFLTKPEDGSNRLTACCIFSSKKDKSYKYTCSISRYSGKPSLRVDDVNPAKFLGGGVNEARKQLADKEYAQAKVTAESLKQQVEAMQGELDEKLRLHNEAKARCEATKAKLHALNAANAKVERIKRKVVEQEERASADNTDEKKKLLKQIMARMKNAVAAIELHVEGNQKLVQASFANAGMRINESIVANEYRIVRNMLRDHEAEFKSLQDREVNARNMLKEEKKRMNATLNQCKERAPLHDDNDNPLPLKAQLEALNVDTIEDAVAALEEAEAKANSIDDNPDVIRQYDKLKREIAQLTDELENLADSKEAKLADIKRHKDPWEDALQRSLGKVNVLFGRYMAELDCAGEIVLKRGNAEPTSSQAEFDGNIRFNFENWGVEIHVKFREKAKMSVLSAQRHSGGERSVSTIMFLMALQELMVSPFRCVDEINQGLDERNERLVFKRIVENSTKAPKTGDLAAHSGQYFLITPKLLPNLHAMEEEAVTVHIITNGPYTFESPVDWNPNHFIEIGKRAVGDKEVDENSPVAPNGSSQDVGSSTGSTSKKKRRTS